MTGALQAETREDALNYGLISLVSDALSSPTLSKKNSHVKEGGDESAVVEIDAGQSCLHAAEESSLVVCRVCQCSEADRTGVASLKVLGISAPSHAIHQNLNASIRHTAVAGCTVEKETLSSSRTNCRISPAGYAYVEMGLTGHVDTLMELGCACKSDLALAHYACALRWFVSRGSVICEICGAPALNVSPVDRNKVLCVLKGKNALQQAHVFPEVGSGETNISSCPIVDHYVAYALPNASEELFQVTAWFDPTGNMTNPPRSFSEEVIDIPDEGLTSTSPAMKWAVEGAGILIATGLLTVTITWLLSPRVDKSVARRGLNVLLGGLCALSIVVFLRFGVLPRIKYGPARYWAILVVFWFLVFGVWASTTRSSRSHT